MKHFARGLIIDGPLFGGAILMSNLDVSGWLSDFAQGFTVALLLIVFFWLQGLRIALLDDAVWLKEDA